MQIKAIRLGNSVKSDKEDTFFTSKDYNIFTFFKNEVQQTCICIEPKRKPNLRVFTTFANVIYWLEDEEEMKKTRPLSSRGSSKPSGQRPVL